MNYSHQEFVKANVLDFITKNIPTVDISVVDEIVMNYVVSIIEDASHDPCFDVEGFVEVMTAYVPGFEEIDVGLVCTWVLELEAEITRREEIAAMAESGNDAKERMNMILEALSTLLPDLKTKASRSRSSSEGSEAAEGPDESEGAVGGCRQTIIESAEYVELYRKLHEMFPNTCIMEIKHCVSIAHGVEEAAAALVIYRDDQAAELAAVALHAASRARLADDHEIKSRIIERYSYVDNNSVAREHRPVAPKTAPEKLVRYLENMVVSLKGERFTEMPRSGDDQDQSKKPRKHHSP